MAWKMGEKGWEKSQSNLRERSINYMEREVQPYRSSTSLTVQPSYGDAWRNNMQKSKTPPNPNPLFL